MNEKKSNDLGNSSSDNVPSATILDRRTVLRLLGGGLGTIIVSGCSGGGGTATLSSSSSGSSSSSSSSSVFTDPSTQVTPEGEIGPYFADDSAAAFNRSNILANLDGSSIQTGIPLTLRLYIFDAQNSFAPVSGSQVDIWHCNAPGVYSDIASENTSTQQWLRGYQISDSSGLVTFQTIFPGWYQGRTTHIHLRIRSSYSQASSTTDGTNTTQLFFPQATINTVNTAISPYSAHGTNPTTNASDRVYTTETHGEMELVLSGDTTSGFTATHAINLPITAE